MSPIDMWTIVLKSLGGGHLGFMAFAIIFSDPRGWSQVELNTEKYIFRRTKCCI